MLANSFGRVSAAVTLLLTVIFSLLTGIGIEAGSLTLSRPASASTEPDLTVTAITLSPEVPEVGETVTISIVVENHGADSADSTRLAGTLDGEEVLSVWLAPFTSGASATKTFTWQAEAGDHSFMALADANDVVDESDETNNSAIISFSTLAADLVVKAITWTPQYVSVGDMVTFAVLIENTGAKASTCSSVEVLIDGILRGKYDVPRILPGNSVTTSFSWKTLAGEHLISATVDPSSKIPENDETNNELSVSYSTALPDLVINNITWSPTILSPGSLARFSIEVGNIGPGKSNPSLFAFFINDDCRYTILSSQIDAGSTMSHTCNFTLGEDEHIIRAVIDYDNRVIEADETNNEKTMDLMVVPDLTLFVNEVEPAYRREGDNVTVRMAVHNIGQAQADECRIDYYLDGELVKQGNIGAMEAGSSVFDEYAYTVQSASHNLKVIVDPENLITETDETNNIKEIDLDNDVGADLALADIAASPESPNIGERVDITATVKNIGSGPASYSNVAFYIDGTENAQSQINHLNSGEEISTTFNWTAQVGTHMVKILADSSDRVNEGNEDNNEKTITITTKTPDLTISSISWYPLVPAPGDTVTFTATVENLGIAQADEFRLQYLVDGLSQGTHSIAELETGESSVKEFSWIAEPGPHEVTLAVDYENKIAEIDEDNNNLTLGFPPPDIAIVSFSSSTTNPGDGEIIILDLEITNQGPGKSTPSHIQIEVDDVPLAVVDMTGLGPDETARQSFSWQAESGVHTIKATADISNAVWEIDESNNESSLELMVLSGGEPGNPSGSSEVTIPGSEAGNSLADVRASITGKVTCIEIGEELILTMKAANAGSTDVQFDANLALPYGMRVVSPDSELAGANTYAISLNLEAGKDEQLDIRIKSIRDGNFVIEGQFTPNSDSMRAFSIPVVVRGENDGLWQLFDNSFYLIAAIGGVVIAISLVILAYSRHS
jgi:subtilase family serine protease